MESKQTSEKPKNTIPLSNKTIPTEETQEVHN